ncbi:hypothetical protein D3C76_1110410 [compost metagenome]
MGQGPAEKQCWLGGVDVHRIRDLAMKKKRLSHMVQQHEENDQAPEGIDGQQSLA